jgi:tripartite-type tricarboxylate transporter receptor subunit TctC
MTRLATLLLAITALTAPAIAQDFPQRPVRIVVPAPPGGTIDVLARAIAQQIAPRWGQPVLVENRAGGGTTIGTAFVAESAPDGHTLIFSGLPMSIAPAMYPKLAYDPMRDFAPVVWVASLPNVLVVHPQVEAKTALELVALAKRQPGKLSFASSGTGSTGHFAGELFKQIAGVDMVHVPYRGGAPAIADVLAGHVPMALENITNVLPHIRAGKLRALGVTTKTRAPSLPDLAPLDQSGLPGFEVSAWFGLYAPAATPAAVVRKLNADLNASIATPEIQDHIARQGAVSVGGPPEALGRQQRDEAVKWTAIIKRLGIKPD